MWESDRSTRVDSTRLRNFCMSLMSQLAMRRISFFLSGRFLCVCARLFLINLLYFTTEVSFLNVIRRCDKHNVAIFYVKTFLFVLTI